jgi:uncharacterized membrane protein YeiH
MDWPSLVTLCDFLATFAFALVGARIAAGRNMDFGGIALVAAVSSLAGGTFRNLFLLTSPSWVLNPWLLLPVLVAVIFTISFKSVEPVGRFILSLDSFGLAVSTVSSAEFALKLHAKPVIAILMGLIGGVTGGLLRDLLAQIPPVLLHRETIGTSCFVGALALVIANEFHPHKLVPVFVGGFFVLLIRELSIHFKWNLPKVSPK